MRVYSILKTLGLCAVLAGCSPTGGPLVSFRDTAMPITSIALFDAAQFAGHWQLVAAFGADICAYDVAAAGGGAFDLAQHSCSGTIRHSAAQITGPGRFTPQNGPRKGIEHWILWVDQTYRTAVIGTVGGEFGMILNRGRDIPADRLRAAREILEWNGYDLSRLVPRK